MKDGSRGLNEVNPKTNYKADEMYQETECTSTDSIVQVKMSNQLLINDD